MFAVTEYPPPPSSCSRPPAPEVTNATQTSVRLPVNVRRARGLARGPIHCHMGLGNRTLREQFRP